MKKSVLGMTACLLVLGAAAGVYASKSTEQRTATEVSTEKAQQNEPSHARSMESIGLDASLTPITNAVIGSTNWNAAYSVPTGYGWVKVYVTNTGTQQLSVAVQAGSPIGTYVKLAPKGSTTYKDVNIVPAKTTVALYNASPTGTGSHYVNLSSPGNMSGTISVKIASTIAELN